MKVDEADRNNGAGKRNPALQAVLCVGRVSLRNREALNNFRDEGVLIVGSGNLVHNLHAYAWDRQQVEPLDWAVRFEGRVRDLLVSGEHKPLIAFETLGPDAALSVPTPDHYLPLLYVIA